MSVAAVWPLFVFLLLFAVCVWGLEHYDILLFANPSAFWILLLTPWFWWMQEAGFSGLGTGRKIITLLVRLAVVGLFAMLLAEPRAVRANKVLSVVYVLDLSDSIGEKAVDSAIRYVVKTAQQRPEKDEAGLVVFGRDAAVELPPRNTFPFETVNSLISKDGTDLEKALSLAAAMLPEDRNGRIVLISDGTATSGALQGAVEHLQSRRIAVDVLPIQYDYQDEVWLEKLELPAFVKEGETYEASVILSSLSGGNGEMVLTENGREIHREPVRFKPGKNRFTLPLYLREPGYYEYAARINVPEGKDGWKNNNIAINHLYLKGKGKTLVVTDPYGERRDSGFLEQFLKKSGREVEIIEAAEFPRDAMNLMPYDCVIFVNVPADSFDAVQLEAARNAVYNLGTGFLMIGGQNSFGPGGYHHTPIEELLPVDMDISNKKVLPKGALAIILHTCEFENGNTWAKEIAKASIKVLGAQDEVGLLAWDGNESWIFPLTPASEYDELVKKINNCQPGDMPSFVGTMEMALEGLKKSDAASKHVIIISDGDPQPPSPALLADYRKAMVTISTVLVDGFHQGSYQTVMRSIANSTGGRFYYPSSPKQLPAIFIKEAKTLKKSMIQNKTFVPKVEFADPTVLKGVSFSKPLHGYVLTTPKGDARRCTVLLRGPDEDQMDPILAVGQYGLGRSAAFTSDLGSNWAKDWLSWQSFQPFVSQLMIAIAKITKDSALRMSCYPSGDKGIIEIEDYHPDPGMLDIEARISGPDGTEKPVLIRQTSPRRYSGSFPIDGKGRYQVIAAGASSNRQERAMGGFVIPYSAEYMQFRSSPGVLKRIADETGGKLLDGHEKGSDIFPEIRKVRHNSRPIFDLFLCIIACLIPIDVGLRRVQIDFKFILDWFRKGKGKARESTPTLGALLKRKEAVSERHRSQAETPASVKTRQEPSSSTPSSPVPSPPAKPIVKKPEIKSPEVRPDKEKTEGEQPVSTTGRLLALKKRRNQDSDNQES